MAQAFSLDALYSSRTSAPPVTQPRAKHETCQSTKGAASTAEKKEGSSLNKEEVTANSDVKKSEKRWKARCIFGKQSISKFEGVFFGRLATEFHWS